MPRITVIMTHFNGAQFLYRAIRSVLDQSYRDFVLILLDDCSTDSSWFNSIESCLDDPRLTVYRSSENVGTYKLKNAFMGKSDSEFLAFHDSDDYSARERFERQVEALLARRTLGLIGTAYYQLGMDNSTKEVFMPENPLVAFDEGNRYLSLHPTWMMRSQLLSVLGGFDGKTRIAGDDEFLYRLMHTAQFSNLPDLLYYKQDHKDSLTLSKDTGFGSPTRSEYADIILERTHRFSSAITSGDYSCLESKPDYSSVTLSRLK